MVHRNHSIIQTSLKSAEEHMALSDGNFSSVLFEPHRVYKRKKPGNTYFPKYSLFQILQREGSILYLWSTFNLPQNYEIHHISKSYFEPSTILTIFYILSPFSSPFLTTHSKLGRCIKF